MQELNYRLNRLIIESACLYDFIGEKSYSLLEEQFENVAKSAISEKKETEQQEEKLSLLRKLIKEEQKNYFEQQKVRVVKLRRKKSCYLIN